MTAALARARPLTEAEKPAAGIMAKDVREPIAPDPWSEGCLRSGLCERKTAIHFSGSCFNIREPHMLPTKP